MSRKAKDRLLNIITYISASFAAIVLATILVFIFSRGYTMLNLNFIFGRYHPQNFYVNVEKPDSNFQKPDSLGRDIYFSESYGFAVKDGFNLQNEEAIRIVYIDKNSPLIKATKYSDINTPIDEKVKVTTKYEINGIYLTYDNPNNNWTAIPSSASDAINYIEQMDVNLRLLVTIPGGGIWGSIQTTLMMIGLTLLIALPMGIGIAIYLTEYAKQNKIISMLRTMIDMLTGVPSIIFGLVGITVFFVYLKSGGPVIYGGAFVMVAILLPVVIRATEESLIQVPQTLRHASLALGANETQTITKVVLPSALPGILTATILSIGRVIGESAALILVSGTIIKDTPELTGPGTTLAVQIWKEMAGENPNIELVTGISIIIIIIVLILNLLLKLTTKYLNKNFS